MGHFSTPGHGKQAIFTLLDCVARGVHSGGERYQGLEQQDLQGQARLHQGGQAYQGAQKVRFIGGNYVLS